MTKGRQYVEGRKFQVSGTPAILPTIRRGQINSDVMELVILNYFANSRIATFNHGCFALKLQMHDVDIEYHFITKCYTPEIVDFLHKIKDGSLKTPDVMIMNSCIWDISR